MAGPNGLLGALAGDDTAPVGGADGAGTDDEDPEQHRERQAAHQNPSAMPSPRGSAPPMRVPSRRTMPWACPAL